MFFFINKNRGHVRKVFARLFFDPLVQSFANWFAKIFTHFFTQIFASAFAKIVADFFATIFRRLVGGAIFAELASIQIPAISRLSPSA